MTNIKTKSFLNYGISLGIRGTTLGCKFLFTLFLGKQYPEEILGSYGLFATTILFCYFALSLSFESYALREIIQKEKERQLSYVRNFIIFFAASLLICLPFFSIFLPNEVIHDRLIFFFVIILSLETFNQICFSLFTILQQPIAANLILFFSQGLWIAIALGLWIIDKTLFTSLDDFLKVWVVGCLASCSYGFFYIKALYKNSSLEAIDWEWIKKGMSVSLIFFCSAMGYKLIEYADRYFIEFKLGTAKLGIYVFYNQIANLLNAAINVSVMLMLYPKLVENYANNDIAGFLAVKRAMYRRILAIGISLSFLAVLFIKLVLIYIGKESYHQEVTVFYILLAANLSMNLSFIPHYCLYAMRKDLTLLFTTLAGSLISISLNLTLISPFGIRGAAIATGISFVVIWALKSFYLNKNSVSLNL